ncbi:MAG: AsmA family protein [Parvibaculaceae bacterium]|nr:AsmA family protein [Parvibaculaceae bacterium]
MKWFFRGLIVIAVLLGAGAALLASLDLGRFREQVEAEASRFTGRDVTIGGELHIGLSLRPTIIVEDLAVANATWATTPKLVTARRAEIRIALLPLLHGEIAPDLIDVDGAVIDLETDEDGHGDWQTQIAQDDQTPTQTDYPALLNGLGAMHATNLEVRYHDRKAGTTNTMVLDEASLVPEGAGARVQLRGRLDDSSIALESLIGGKAGDVRLGDTSFTVGQTSMKGDLALTGTAPGSYKISGALRGDQFDLTPVLDAHPDAAHVFGRTPLPFALLRMGSADVTLDIARLSYRKLVFDKVDAPVRVAAGKLDLPLRGFYRGSPVAFHIRADGVSYAAGVEGGSTGFDLGKLLSDLNLTTLVSARGDLAVKLSGKGPSVHDIASSLSGQSEMAASDGTIGTRTFELVATDLAQVLIPKGSNRNETKLACFLSRFDYVNGVGTSRAFAFETSDIVTTGVGGLNLRGETVDMLLQPKPRDPSLISLSTPVRISGRLDNPGISLDNMGLARKAAEVAGSAALTGGVGAILPLISFGGGAAASSGNCAVLARDAAGKKHDGITGTIEKGGNEAGAAVKDAAKGVGGFFNDLGKDIGKAFK